MNRVRIEATATYIAVVTLVILVFAAILGVADGLFNWDLLPPLLDKIAVLTMATLAIVLTGSVLVSIMLNVSIIADRIDAIARKGDEE